jgi:hypothetical protein
VKILRTNYLGKFETHAEVSCEINTVDPRKSNGLILEQLETRAKKFEKNSV